MKKNLVTWTVMAAVPVLALMTASAQAGDTCSIIKAMCPPDQAPTSASVPEPATLTLLALGFGGAGLAALRRRRKKDE